MPRDFEKVLNDALIKLVDPNEGTRAAAAIGIYKMVQSAGIDVREWRWGPAVIEEETVLIEDKVCEFCGSDISHRSPQAKYCDGGACRQAAHRRRHSR